MAGLSVRPVASTRSCCHRAMTARDSSAVMRWARSGVPLSSGCRNSWGMGYFSIFGTGRRTRIGRTRIGNPGLLKGDCPPSRTQDPHSLVRYSYVCLRQSHFKSPGIPFQVSTEPTRAGTGTRPADCLVCRLVCRRQTCHPIRRCRRRSRSRLPNNSRAAYS